MPKYKTNFLTDVIVKVDFNPILAISSNEPAAFQGAIRELYPRLNRLEGVEIRIDGSAPAKGLGRRWQFISQGKDEIVELDQSYISLIFKKYNSYEDFINKFRTVYDAFVVEYKPTLINRIGLRYINQIRLDGNPFEWGDYLINPLFASFEAFNGVGDMARHMSTCEMKMDDHNVIVNYGLFNSQYPNPIAVKEFILDFDAVYTEECDSAVVLQTVERFHGEIEKLFESFIREDLRELMGVDDDE